MSFLGVQDKLILDKYSGSNFLIVNKLLLQKHGPVNALFISFLIDQFQYIMRQNAILGKGWFYCTNNRVVAELGISQYSMRTVKKYWEGLGVLKMRFAGMPSKLYYKIDFQRLEEITDRCVVNNPQKGNHTRVVVTDNPCLVGSDNPLHTNNKNNNTKTSKERAFLDIGKQPMKRTKFPNKQPNPPIKTEPIAVPRPKDTLTHLRDILPPKTLKDSDFVSAWTQYSYHRIAKRSPLERLTKIGVRSIMRKLVMECGMEKETIIASIEQSVAKGWLGLFPPRGVFQPKKSNTANSCTQTTDYSNVDYVYIDGKLYDPKEIE